MRVYAEQQKRVGAHILIRVANDGIVRQIFALYINIYIYIYIFMLYIKMCLNQLRSHPKILGPCNSINLMEKMGCMMGINQSIFLGMPSLNRCHTGSTKCSF